MLRAIRRMAGVPTQYKRRWSAKLRPMPGAMPWNRGRAAGILCAARLCAVMISKAKSPAAGTAGQKRCKGMIEVTPQMLLVVCGLVFLASFIDSIAGGGGLISLPAYLAVGLPTAYAAGTNKLTASAGTVMAVLRFGRGKKIDWSVALLAATGALPGAYAGAWLMQLLPAATSRVILMVMIPLAAVIIFAREKLGHDWHVSVRRPRLAALLIGLSIGFYDGLVGPGTGTFLIILFTALLGMGDVDASGSAKVVNLASNVAALISMLLGGHVLWSLGLPAMCCSVLGGYLGSGMALKRGARLVRGVMLVVLALLMIKLIYDMCIG